ncbi:MAG: homoserine kinase [Acidobacteria bacterium]|nr:homoserine kinase [Acidobacteriota bacterium]
MQEVRVITPATVANVVCGFDCLGFALTEPFDEMTLRRTDDPGIRIINRDEFGLPTKPEENVTGVVAAAALKRAGTDFGLEIEITKHIMPGSGIGSSSASAAGAAVAVNRLLGDKFSKLELVDLAMEGEKLASGSRHADNVAPCIFGGFTLVRSTEPLDVVTLEFPPLWATIIHPQIEIKTAEARAILPKDVPLNTAVKQWGNVGSLVAGLAKGDYGLIARSLEDLIVEPVRKSLIPKFDEVKEASLSAGALGGGISGSGPSIFMLSEGAATAEKVKIEMRSVYSRTDIEFNMYVSELASSGARSL